MWQHDWWRRTQPLRSADGKDKEWCGSANGSRTELTPKQEDVQQRFSHHQHDVGPLSRNIAEYGMGRQAVMP